MGITHFGPNAGIAIGTGLYVGAYGAETQIINSSGAFVGTISFVNLTTSGDTTLGNGTSDTTTVNGTLIVPTTSVGVRFNNDADTGIQKGSVGNLFLMIAGGTSIMEVATSSINVKKQVRGTTGAASAPSFSFEVDTDNGMYLSGTNAIGFATAGVARGGIGNTGIWTLGSASSTVTHAINGNINVTRNSTLGASGSHTLTVRGAATIGTTATTVTHTVNSHLTMVGGQVKLTNGNATAASLTFASTTGLGVYRVGSGVLGFTAGGVLQMRIDSSQVEVTPKMFVSGGVRTKNSTANVTNPPTDAELDSAFGTGASAGTGFIGTLNDNGSGTAAFLVFSDGTNWWYLAGTKAT